MNENDWVVVKTFMSRLEAEVALSYLKSQGIEGIISADDAGGMRPFPMQFTAGAELKVLRQDVEEAKKLLGF
jgi:hypothetical protein